MNFRKFGMAFALFAAFGLIACGDDNSSSSSDKENFVDLNGEPMKCTVENDGDTVVTTVRAGAGFYTASIYLTDKNVVTESETHYVNNAIFEDECKKAKAYEGNLYSSVECKDKVVYIVENGELFEGYTMEDVKAETQEFCKVVDGVKYKKLNEKLEEFFGIDDDAELEKLGEKLMTCSVEQSKDTIFVNSVRGDGTYKYKLYIQDGYTINEEESKFTYYSSYLSKCAEVKESSEEGTKTLCKGNSVLNIERKEMKEGESLESVKEEVETACKVFDGKKFKDYERIFWEMIAQSLSSSTDGEYAE